MLLTEKIIKYDDDGIPYTTQRSIVFESHSYIEAVRDNGGYALANKKDYQETCPVCHSVACEELQIDDDLVMSCEVSADYYKNNEDYQRIADV